MMFLFTSHRLKTVSSSSENLGVLAYPKNTDGDRIFSSHDSRIA